MSGQILKMTPLENCSLKFWLKSYIDTQTGYYCNNSYKIIKIKYLLLLKNEIYIVDNIL